MTTDNLIQLGAALMQQQCATKPHVKQMRDSLSVERLARTIYEEASQYYQIGHALPWEGLTQTRRQVFRDLAFDCLDAPESKPPKCMICGCVFVDELNQACPMCAAGRL